MIEQLEHRTLLSNDLFDGRRYLVGGQTAFEGLVVHDFNGDGRQDVAAAIINSNKLTVRLGQPDGSYLPATTYTVRNSLVQLDSADLDQDGHVDLITTNQSDRSVSVLMGRSDGTFAQSVRYGLSFQAWSTAVGDFNADGKLDLIVAADSLDVSILPGTGNGGFGAATTFTGMLSQSSLVAGDFNHDQLCDFALTKSNTGDLIVYLNQGGMVFAPSAPQQTITLTPQKACAADVNGDGNLDIFVRGSDANVAVFRGAADGSFTRLVTYAVPSNGEGRSLHIVDYNADGKLDIVMGGAKINVLYGRGDATFQSPVVLTIEPRAVPQLQDVVDLNGDGRLDLATTPLPDFMPLYQRSDGTFGTFRSFQVHPSLSETARSVKLGDVTGDGRVDALVLTSSNPTVVVLPGVGNGTFGSPVSYSTAKACFKMILKDLNGDGLLDVAALQTSTPAISVLLGRAGGGFAAAAEYALPGLVETIEAADMDLDGRQDLVVGGTNALVVLRGQTDGTFGTPMTRALPIYPDAMAVTDLDGDGRSDLAIANEDQPTLYIMHGNPDGSFSQLATYGISSGARAMQVADFNRDGLIDLACACTNGDTVAVLNATGNGVFAPAVSYVGPTCEDMVAGDFNNDGLIDIASLRGYAVALLLNSGASFQPMHVYLCGNAPNALAVGDVNGDGHVDLAVSCSQNGGFVSIMPNIASPPIAQLDGRTLRIDLGHADDAVTLSQAAGVLTVGTTSSSSQFSGAVFDAIVVDGTADSDSFSVNTTLSAPLTFNGNGGNDVLNVRGGTLAVQYDLGALAPGISLNLLDGGNVDFSTSQHLNGLNIGAGCVATFAAHLRGVLSLKQLTLSPTALLDLNESQCVLDYNGASPLSMMQSLVNAARAGGAWTGTGITSSAARSASPRNTTLGIIEASEYKTLYGPTATFAGETLDELAVLVKYTYYGDTDFNGVVNFDDYARIDAGFSQGRGGWLNGDFDSNGVVNFDDYSLIDLAFNTQGSPLRPGGAKNRSGAGR